MRSDPDYIEGEGRDEVWVTRDNRRIWVSEMDESHVRNALRMLIRREKKIRALRVISRTFAGVEDFDDGRWGDNA